MNAKIFDIDGYLIEKTKTKRVVKSIERENYSRSKEHTLCKLTRLQARAVIMSQYGMLDCANNFENKYKSRKCSECNTLNDEIHWINLCKRWENVNYYYIAKKVDWNMLDSDNYEDLKCMANVVLSIWDLKNGRNCNIGTDG